MGRVARVDVGNHVYHVLNRAVGRLRIFESNDDYLIFEEILREAQKMVDMRVLAYVLMPNHWHMELYPRKDGDMSEFMHWLTNAHTRRVHAYTNTTGTGPLYQGRYKSFLIQKDEHLLTVLKYIERNPVRARLSKLPENWRWGSAYVRLRGTERQRDLLAELPVELPRNYRAWIHGLDKEDDLEAIRGSAMRSTPHGGSMWVEQMIEAHALQSTVRKPGRPVGKQ